jgi:hypothetical protein
MMPGTRLARVIMYVIAIIIALGLVLGAVIYPMSL